MVVLEECELPTVGEMVQESLLSCKTFKYSRFHGGTSHNPAAAGCGDPAPSAATAAAAAAPAAAAATAERNPVSVPLKQTGKALQALGKAVAEAAVAEGRTASSAAQSWFAQQRMGLASPDRPAGVLFLDDQQPRQRDAGVLQIDLAAGDESHSVRRGRLLFGGGSRHSLEEEIAVVEGVPPSEPHTVTLSRPPSTGAAALEAVRCAGLARHEL